MADFDWDKPDKQTFAWDTAQPVSPAETGPVVGAKSAELIPTGGTPTVEKRTPAGEPKFAEKAAMYATAVPATGLAAGALRTATAGTKAAPYTARLAQAVIPETGKGLAAATGGAAATAIPAEYARYQAEKAGFGPVGQEVTEAGTALGLGGVGALGRYGYGKAADLARALKGVKPEPLRTKTTEQLGQLTAQQERELERTRGVQKEISKQPSVAAQREKERFPGDISETKLAERVAPEKLSVREKMGARARTAEQEAAEAKVAADIARQDLQRTESTLNALEQRMSSQRGITPDQLGGEIQSTVSKLANEGIAARKRMAGYDTVFQKAGDAPTVNTGGIDKRIQEQLKETRNPTLQNILREIRSQLTTGAKIDEATGVFSGGTNKLSLKSADSLKGYLDSVTQGRVDKYGKLDKEIVGAVNKIKAQLMTEAKAAHPEYGEAINKFRQMSRPLDIVERNGALKKVIDEDPISTAYRMTEAEAAGYVIRKANAGNPVFARLLQVRPELKESSRLYFTKDLFGKEAAPSAKSFETWLANNERALKQTGLYNEFNTLRKAQTAAQDAVDVAKGIATSAEQKATTAAKEATKAKSLSEKSETRLQQALKTAETPEEFAARYARTERPKQTPEQARTKFATQADRQQASLDALSELNSNLTRAKEAADVQREVKNTAEKLKDLGLINEQQRDQMLREVQGLGVSIEAKEEAKKKVKNILYGAGALIGLSYGGRRLVSGFE